jgi:hypothetical protein
LSKLSPNYDFSVDWIFKHAVRRALEDLQLDLRLSGEPEFETVEEAKEAMVSRVAESVESTGLEGVKVEMWADRLVFVFFGRSHNMNLLVESVSRLDVPTLDSAYYAAERREKAHGALRGWLHGLEAEEEKDAAVGRGARK